MVEWWNLNRYSQQGWESLNYLFKCFFFRRSNKSGGKNQGKRSKMKGLAVLVQRRALWMLGIADLILDECEKDKDFNLEELLPDLCLPEEDNNEEESIEELGMR